MSLHYCSILPQNHDSDYLEESRRIRAEQDRAYAESLAADIEKEELKVKLMFLYVRTITFIIHFIIVQESEKGRSKFTFSLNSCHPLIILCEVGKVTRHVFVAVTIKD